MKKNKVAFTMIELIVVTLIMVLLTSSSVFYFFDFTDNRELIIQADLLEDDISDLNKQVKNFEISDYNLYFSLGNNYYTGSINNLGTDDLVVFAINPAGTGSFSIPGGSSALVWNYNIYEDDKQIITKITASDSSQEYSFDVTKNYKISGYVGGVATNTIILKKLTSIESGIELVGMDPVNGIFSNKNNIITPNFSLELEKASARHTLLLK